MPPPPPPPLIGEKNRKGEGVGDWYMPLHTTYPLIMAFNVQENAGFIHEISKNLPTVPGTPPPCYEFRNNLTCKAESRGQSIKFNFNFIVQWKFVLLTFT